MIADYEPKERKPLVLKGYSIKDHHYDHYDNYDAINVDRAVDIPIDYDGVIGVPITILSYLWEDGLIHCAYTKKATPKSDFFIECLEKNLIFLSGTQFEIVGCADADIVPNGWQGMTANFVELYYKQGNTGSYKEGNRLASYIDNNGMAKVPYKRLLIKKVS